ncbi:hypothetical protein [Flavobacterium sp.]|uniref:hypothetical protein n=1 Tax=Flavobacterium sp. TaxID=239 RepID=UPI003D2E2923
MRRYLLLCSIVILTICSCRSDFDFEPSTGNLRFSKDTVYLDTVFTNIGSSTYTLKVYNRSNRNISIPNIQLGEGNNSKYRLMVDGMPGRVFNNVELLARDSMFIFIETTINYDDYANSETTFLYTDHIEFGTNSDFQKVELVTLVQDAVFLYPKKFSDGTTETLPIGSDEIYGFYLDPADPMNGDELHWTNTKPYVIYGYAAVPPTNTLVVDAGVRAHFHAESGIIVANTASLQVNGTTSLTEDLENEVIFESDRLEPLYSDVPGQWGTVWFTQGSTNNSITNLTLKNATVGMLVSGNDGNSTPTLDLTNVQIYNCSNVGLLARTGNIVGRNVVINNCGETSLSCSFGGSYEFTHCTFANYWPKPNQTSVLIDDFDGSATYALTKADFRNCIIFGSPNLAISLNKEGTTFNYQFDHCLIKFADFSNQFTTHPEYQFTGTKYANCIISRSSTNNIPNFKNTDVNELIIGSASAAKGTANFTYSTFNDILGNSRTNPSDIGAYNFITF